MTDDVDDVAVGGPDEESSHAPRFIGERMHDLVSTPASVGLCLVRVGADVDRDDGILRCAGIAGYELYRGPPSAEAYLATQPRFIASTLRPRYSR
jgi:hypothetical protein